MKKAPMIIKLQTSQRFVCSSNLRVILLHVPPHPLDLVLHGGTEHALEALPLQRHVVSLVVDLELVHALAQLGAARHPADEVGGRGGGEAGADGGGRHQDRHLLHALEGVHLPPVQPHHLLRGQLPEPLELLRHVHDHVVLGPALLLVVLEHDVLLHVAGVVVISLELADGAHQEPPHLGVMSRNSKN